MMLPFYNFISQKTYLSLRLVSYDQNNKMQDGSHVFHWISDRLYFVGYYENTDNGIQ